MVPYILHVTFMNDSEVKEFIHTVLDNKLAACCQCIKTESFFYYENKVVNTNETLVILKTFDINIENIRKVCEDVHSYDVYQFIGYEMKVYNERYFEWMKHECSIKK